MWGGKPLAGLQQLSSKYRSVHLAKDDTKESGSFFIRVCPKLQVHVDDVGRYHGEE